MLGGVAVRLAEGVDPDVAWMRTSSSRIFR